MATRKSEKTGDSMEAKRRSGLWGELDFFERDSGRTNARSHTARFVSAVMITSAVFVMLTYTLLFVSGFRTVIARPANQQTQSSSKTSSIPQYFQTSPKLFAGEFTHFRHLVQD